MRTKVYTNNENCKNCISVKDKLNNDNIEFEYLAVSYKDILVIANKYNHPSIPIVIFDDNVVFGDPDTIVEHIKKELK